MKSNIIIQRVRSFECLASKLLSGGIFDNELDALMPAEVAR